ncbi:MAG TPA: rRNA adenine N-6-methyltransferase family protein, partial [Cellvibrionaceae bacterium]|nr:rRNA adenine N-6-methyltransferase family protein [Cellvibrionaceae bacterium]
SHAEHLEAVVFMVQKEVADRLCAAPGSRMYGVPSVKLAWYATAQPAGTVSASVFWPAPRIASALNPSERRRLQALASA